MFLRERRFGSWIGWGGGELGLGIIGAVLGG